MKKFLKTCAFTFVSACLLTAPSLIAQTKLTIGVQNYKEYLPYSKFDPKLKSYKGFNREILDLFSHTKGYKFTYKALPLKRLQRQFISGKVDFKYPDNKYWAADIKKGKNIKYSAPVVHFIDGVMVNSSNKDMGISSLKVLGTVRGFTPFVYLDHIKQGKLKIRENNEIAGLFMQVHKKRIDGAYMNIAVSEYYLDKMGDNVHLQFDPNLPYAKSTRHLSSHKHPNIISEFNRFMKENKNEVEKLKKKFNVEKGVLKYL